MTDTVQDSYLGWHDLVHAPLCKRPAWEAQTQVDEWATRDGAGATSHACGNEDCDHGNRFELTTIRLVCRSCGMVRILAGEVRSESHTTVERLGYGSAPRKVGSLLLWPGQPWFRVGRMHHDHPHDFLVTQSGVTHVEQADVVGCIYLWKGKLGATTWSAAAVQDPNGTFAPGKLRWKRVTEGLRTATAGAKFIAAELAAADGEN
ncbi:hypothetical protein [Streptomyces sp. NBC_00198]|uniref:hypothetical protein n=1 Tax=Streptomyces sp. NBC_00198 TaxID=2975677 RepID=UPI00224DFF94|nr:hypothetical protein [Streptomyces sp. NBC_00198]MCX5285981.1 hypothetical protein [Streptomyces sp. NBC_00198]MCX5286290.1 hypothetical protein [Streptomyces sp. NBC_00198]